MDNKLQDLERQHKKDPDNNKLKRLYHKELVRSGAKNFVKRTTMLNNLFDPLQKKIKLSDLQESISELIEEYGEESELFGILTTSSRCFLSWKLEYQDLENEEEYQKRKKLEQIDATSKELDSTLEKLSILGLSKKDIAKILSSKLNSGSNSEKADSSLDQNQELFDILVEVFQNARFP